MTTAENGGQQTGYLRAISSKRLSPAGSSRVLVQGVGGGFRSCARHPSNDPPPCRGRAGQCSAGRLQSSRMASNPYGLALGPQGAEIRVMALLEQLAGVAHWPQGSPDCGCWHRCSRAKRSGQQLLAKARIPSSSQACPGRPAWAVWLRACQSGSTRDAWPLACEVVIQRGLDRRLDLVRRLAGVDHLDGIVGRRAPGNDGGCVQRS